MYIAFFIYSLAGVSKFAAQKEFLSFQYIQCLVGLVCVFVLYAFLWQQILKQIPLSVAMAHKAIVLVLGVFWAFLLFNESLSLKFIIVTAVAFLALAGILIILYFSV